MKLNELERESALWKKIEGELTGRLKVLREKNDGALTLQETDRCRGQIATVKEILNWGIPEQRIE